MADDAATAEAAEPTDPGGDESRDNLTLIFETMQLFAARLEAIETAMSSGEPSAPVLAQLHAKMTEDEMRALRRQQAIEVVRQGDATQAALLSRLKQTGLLGPNVLAIVNILAKYDEFVIPTREFLADKLEKLMAAREEIAKAGA